MKSEEKRWAGGRFLILFVPRGGKKSMLLPASFSTSESVFVHKFFFTSFLNPKKQVENSLQILTSSDIDRVGKRTMDISEKKKKREFLIFIDLFFQYESQFPIELNRFCHVKNRSSSKSFSRF